MKSSKISSMIDELVEENLELKRIEETKFKILELIKVLLFTLKFVLFNVYFIHFVIVVKMYPKILF